MPVRIEYEPMEKVGSCFYVREGAGSTFPHSYGKRTAVFKCGLCGKEFESTIANVRNGNTTSCGCYHKSVVRKMALRHGLDKHPLYSVWMDVKSRCYNHNNKSYGYYGAKGIALYGPWIEDFKSFYDYVTVLPNYNESNLGIRGLTIDREDNDGHYEPGNIRWVTMSVQALNRRVYKSKSGYTGVHAHSGGFEVRISVNQEIIYLGFYSDKKIALNVRNKYIIDNNLKYHKIQEWRG